MSWSSSPCQKDGIKYVWTSEALISMNPYKWVACYIVLSCLWMGFLVATSQISWRDALSTLTVHGRINSSTTRNSCISNGTLYSLYVQLVDTMYRLYLSNIVGVIYFVSNTVKNFDTSCIQFAATKWQKVQGRVKTKHKCSLYPIF